MDALLEKELLEKIGKENTEAFKKQKTEIEGQITAAAAQFKAGLMTEVEFKAFQTEKLEPIQKTLGTLETAVKEQGIRVNAILERSTPNSKTLEQFIEELAPQIKAMREEGSGKHMIFTGAQLKAAGVNSIAGAIPAASPYAPGIGGPLEIFDVVRNPNFITSKIDLGRTNQARLAWANEIEAIQGGAALVAEGATKPQTQHQYTIETSIAKKVAGWIELTDEFEQDLPNFASNVRRQLQIDVERAWDDQIQVDVQTAARPYEITGLNGQISFANRWDAVLAFMAQVGFYNFIPNGIAMNWITNALLKTEKNTNGTYLLPSFAGEVERLSVYANKMAINTALVGDFKQYHVDIYKDFMLKVGWINDELIQNKFAIVGEMRYHSYISSARKKALVYDSLTEAANTINGSGSI